MGTVLKFSKRVDPPGKLTPLTVGDLRQALLKLPDDMAVFVETSYDGGELLLGDLHAADVNERCDGEAALYLWCDTDVLTEDEVKGRP